MGKAKHPLERNGTKKFVTIATDQLIKADWNYKQEDPQMTEKLKGNFARNGQLENLVVRDHPSGKKEIVNGNHRLDIINDLAIKEVLVCDLGNISKAAAMRIAVELNETKFEPDYMKLGTVIEAIAGEFKLPDLEQTLPFDQDQLKDYLSLGKYNWDTAVPPTREGTGKKMDAKTSHTELKIEMTTQQLNAWNNWVTHSGEATEAGALMKAIKAAQKVHK